MKHGALHPGSTSRRLKGIFSLELDTGRGSGELAIVLNSKWAGSVLNFVAVNERIAYLDLATRGFRVRVVAAYFPHSGYGDVHVHAVYNILSTLRSEAKAKHYRFIVGADCNAQAGSRTEFDDPVVIGTNGLNKENSRGQWLKQWATSEALVLCNTFFSKPPSGRSTHTNTKGTTRQIDYIMTDRKTWKHVKDCM